MDSEESYPSMPTYISHSRYLGAANVWSVDVKIVSASYITDILGTPGYTWINPDPEIRLDKLY